MSVTVLFENQYECTYMGSGARLPPYEASNADFKMWNASPPMLPSSLRAKSPVAEKSHTAASEQPEQAVELGEQMRLSSWKWSW